MSNENLKNYRYFQLTPALSDALQDEYKSIAADREDAITEVLAKYNAVAYESGTFNNVERISGLVVEEGAPIANEKHIKITKRMPFEGKRCLVVAGKGNTKLGKALQAELDVAAEALNKTPELSQWLLDRFDAARMVTGTPRKGHPGRPLLRSVAGLSKRLEDGKKRVVFAIPHIEGTSTKPFDAPDGFTAITYGHFYDMTN